MSAHIAEPIAELGPLFELEERPGPTPERARFDGPIETDEAGRCERLGGQLADIFQAIQDGGAYTLEDLHRITGHPAASISAQLRHLRKKQFGGFVVTKKHKGRGLYVYRLRLRSDGTPARAGDGS